jgi:hypothetical protein
MQNILFQELIMANELVVGIIGIIVTVIIGVIPPVIIYILGNNAVRKEKVSQERLRKEQEERYSIKIQALEEQIRNYQSGMLAGLDRTELKEAIQSICNAEKDLIQLTANPDSAVTLNNIADKIKRGTFFLNRLNVT